MLHIFHAHFTTPALSTPALSTLATWCRIVHSCIFHPCHIVPNCPLPHCPLPQIQRSHMNALLLLLCDRAIGRIARLARPPVCPSVPYGFLTRKQKASKKSIVCRFFGAAVIDVLILGLKGHQKSQEFSHVWRIHVYSRVADQARRTTQAPTANYA